MKPNLTKAQVAAQAAAGAGIVAASCFFLAAAGTAAIGRYLYRRLRRPAERH